MIDTSQLELEVREVRKEAADIVCLQLVDPNGDRLQAAAAGSHIEVHLLNGLVRQYSLSKCPPSYDCYEIAVLLEKSSRGGSLAIHQVKKGDRLTVSKPRNNFALAGSEANHHLLIAGGIGITPLIAMVSELERRDAKFHLHYLVRSPDRAAYRDRVQQLVDRGSATIHYSAEGSQKFNIEAELQSPIPAQHVYVCGPPRLMAVARSSVGAWAPHTVHFEQFSGDPIAMEEDEWESVAFKVVAAKSGKQVWVPENTSITAALRSEGIEVPTSCEAGYCGACLTRYLSGDPVHRDSVLSRADQRKFAMICRARCRSSELTLDL